MEGINSLLLVVLATSTFVWTLDSWPIGILWLWVLWVFGLVLSWEWWSRYSFSKLSPKVGKVWTILNSAPTEWITSLRPRVSSDVDSSSKKKMENEEMILLNYYIGMMIYLLYSIFTPSLQRSHLNKGYTHLFEM